MFDWLIPLLIVAILLIWILDYLDLLDILELVAAVVGLIVSAVAAVVKLVVLLLRRLIDWSTSRLMTPQSSSPPSLPTPRGSGRFNRRAQPPSPGKEHREDKG